MNYLTAYLTSPSEPEAVRCWRPACRDESEQCYECGSIECPSCEDWTEQYDSIPRCKKCGPSFIQLWPAFHYNGGLEIFDAEWQAELYPHIAKNHFGPVSVIFRETWGICTTVLNPVHKKERAA